MDYEVLGPGDVPAAGDWRHGDLVRYLPEAEREDLELWLMECAYRYCRALEDRPDSPVALAAGDGDPRPGRRDAGRSGPSGR